MGSGGDGAQAQWKNVADELNENIRLLNVFIEDPALLKKLKTQFPKLVKETQVAMKDYPLYLGQETAEKDNPTQSEYKQQINCGSVQPEMNLGQERDAINFSENKLIKVSRPRLRCYFDSREQIRRLVLHEYLGLMGITEIENGTTAYKMTNALLKGFKFIQTFDDGLETNWVRDCRGLQTIGLKNSFDAELEPQRVFKLANDIDCSESASWNNGAGLLPLILADNLDGNGYSIKNLHIAATKPIEQIVTISKIDDDNGIYFGIDGHSLFFTTCSHCSIANLSIENAIGEGGSLLVAYARGSIRNVSVSGNLHGKAVHMAGLAEENYGTISYCSSNVQIIQEQKSENEIASQSSGLLVAVNHGSIHHSLAYGRISGYGGIGGLVGFNYGSISDVQSWMQIVSRLASSVGGLAGMNSGTIRNSRAHGNIQIVDFRPIETPEAIKQKNPDMYFGNYVGGLVGEMSGNATNEERLGQNYPTAIIIPVTLNI